MMCRQNLLFVLPKWTVRQQKQQLLQTRGV